MNSGRRLSKANKGFTLVEMIISVAFLAIVSVVMLQLFINARNLGLKGHDLDQGVQFSKSVIETFKAGKNPADFRNSNLMSSTSVSEDGDAVSFKLYLDKEWKTLDGSDSSLIDKSSFIAAIDVKPSGSVGNSMDKKGIYSIRIIIDRIRPYSLDESKNNEVYRITAEKYFAGIK